MAKVTSEESSNWHDSRVKHKQDGKNWIRSIITLGLSVTSYNLNYFNHVIFGSSDHLLEDMNTTYETKWSGLHYNPKELTSQARDIIDLGLNFRLDCVYIHVEYKVIKS